MPPASSDLVLAGQLAKRIVAMGNGSVRRVVMIGSRARGNPRPDSDLDLVILVEIPPLAKPWGGDEFSRAARAFRAGLGVLPLPVDLWVRTTDRFAETSAVSGGVEYLVGAEGHTLFEAPLARPTVVRVSPHNVRREFVSAWMHHALLAVEALVNTGGGGDLATVELIIGRLITALHIHHRLDLQAFGSVLEHADRTPTREGKRIATALARRLGEGESPRVIALSASRQVLSYLVRDTLQAKSLRRVDVRLRACEASMRLDVVGRKAELGGVDDIRPMLRDLEK